MSIHPTAIIDPVADVGHGVRIGPFVVVEGDVRIGAGCSLRAGAHLVGPLTMGRGNLVCSGAVLGERPQHLKYNDEPTGVEIGDHNVFREHVTVHRGTTQAWTSAPFTPPGVRISETTPRNSPVSSNRTPSAPDSVQTTE